MPHGRPKSPWDERTWPPPPSLKKGTSGASTAKKSASMPSFLKAQLQTLCLSPAHSSAIFQAPGPECEALELLPGRYTAEWGGQRSQILLDGFGCKTKGPVLIGRLEYDSDRTPTHTFEAIVETLSKKDREDWKPWKAEKIISSRSPFLPRHGLPGIGYYHWTLSPVLWGNFITISSHTMEEEGGEVWFFDWSTSAPRDSFFRDSPPAQHYREVIRVTKGSKSTQTVIDIVSYVRMRWNRDCPWQTPYYRPAQLRDYCLQIDASIWLLHPPGHNCGQCPVIVALADPPEGQTDLRFRRAALLHPPRLRKYFFNSTAHSHKNLLRQFPNFGEAYEEMEYFPSRGGSPSPP